MTLFQKEYDSKNWTFKKKRLKELNFFFFEYDSKNWTLFFWIRLKESNLFLNVTQIEIFGWKLVKKTRNWFFHMTRRIEPASFSIWLKELNLFRLDSKIWCYSVWPKELNFFWLGLTELDPFLEYDSENWIFSWVFYMSTFFKNDAENWTFFSLNMTQRIEPFFLWMWRKELNPFFFGCGVEGWNFFLECGAKCWTLFLFDAKRRTFISLIWMTPRIVFSNKKYSVDWTFWNMTRRIEHLNHVSKRRLREWNYLKFFFEMTHRIEPFFWTFSIWLKELNPLFFSKRLKELNIFFKKCSKNWTSLSFELLFTWLNELNFFSIWLEELSLFKYDSKSWTFFLKKKWLKNLNLRLSMTQRSDPFWTWLKEVNFFEHYSENRTLFLRRRKELNLFLNLTQRIDFSQNDAKNWNLFSKYDAKNWNFFFWIWLKELNFFSHMTQRNEIWKKTQRVELVFSNMTYRIEPLLFSLIWFKELNFVSKKKTLKKIEIFFVGKWLTELNSL